MARRGTAFSAGGYYHIYNRGCNRENIFLCEENYRYLLSLLRSRISSYQVSIIAYCFMPNHYHFLFREDGRPGISNLMQSIFNAYSKAFNKRYSRFGTLFEGPFRSINVDKEEYLIRLCRYIHRNPLDAGLVVKLEDWLYSNYLEWLGCRRGMLVDQKFVKEHFATAEEYKQFVFDYDQESKTEKQLEEYLF